MRKRVFQVLGLCLLLCCSGYAFSGDDDGIGYESGLFEDWEFGMGVGYDTRHVEDEEGEEEFENGAYSFEIELEKYFEDLGELELEFEAVSGVTENYTEIEVGVSFSREIFDDLVAKLTYSWFHESTGRPEEEDDDDDDDNGNGRSDDDDDDDEEEEGGGGTDDEWGVSFEYTGFEWVDLDAGMLSSFDHGGQIYWFGVGKSFWFGDIEITPHIGVWYDSDYVTEGYDGLNHIKYDITAEWEFWEDTSLEMRLGYVKAQENLVREAREEGERSKDPAWVGFSVEHEF